MNGPLFRDWSVKRMNRLLSWLTPVGLGVVLAVAVAGPYFNNDLIGMVP